jgi:signal transduction histidine kinase
MLQEAQLAHAEEREAAARQSAAESELRRQEAEDRRRAQELLIDVTSHELRQPVSAILNCASLIRSNYTKVREDLEKAISENSVFRPDKALLTTIDEDLEALGAS